MGAEESKPVAEVRTEVHTVYRDKIIHAPAPPPEVRTVYRDKIIHVPAPAPAPAPTPPPQPFLDAEWRKWKNKDTLLKGVKEYDREDEDIKHIRIMLYGPVGAGKSSFINAVSSCLRGRMSLSAKVDAMGGESFTLKYKTHKIKKGKGQHFPLVFNDIMGLEEKDGIKEEDLKLALGGHIKDGYAFNPVSAMTRIKGPNNPFYNPEPTPEDKIHVLVCVVPANQVAVLTEAFTNKIRQITLAARDLDIPQLCIVTKIDKAHPLMEKDVKNAYKMKIVKEKMKQFSDAVGIPVNCIFPVKNYHEEADVHNDVDVLILEALQHMINVGEDFIDDM